LRRSALGRGLLLRWTLAERRDHVYATGDHDFRTDFDLSRKPEVTAVRFVVAGENLRLVGRPEMYRAS